MPNIIHQVICKVMQVIAICKYFITTNKVEKLLNVLSLPSKGSSKDVPVDSLEKKTVRLSYINLCLCVCVTYKHAF